MQACFSGRTAVASRFDHAGWGGRCAAAARRSTSLICQRARQRRLHVRPPRMPMPCGCSSASGTQSFDQENVEQSKSALREALQVAIDEEDYSRAAALKAQLQQLELRDPLVSLRLALDTAVEEERYQARPNAP